MTDTIKHPTMDNLTEHQAQRMLDNIMNPPLNNKTTAVILHDAEERHVPAEMPVARIAVIADQLHVTICKEEDRDGSFIYTYSGQIAVDIHAFLNSLQNLINNEGDYEFSYLMHPIA